MHQHFKVRALCAGGALSALLVVAVITGCGGGSGSALSGAGGGGNGGGGNGGGVGANFTVSPVRAAPGTLITLGGVSLADGDDVTIKFGAEETVIHARGAQSTVYVPPFLDGSAHAITPGAPVAVTLSINGGATRTATSSFTVLPLPAAPGETKALATQMTDLSAALNTISTDLLAPLGADGGLDPTIAAHGAALAAGSLYLTGGANNPNSVAAILNGTAPVLEGKPLPTELLGSLLAQADAGKDMEDFAAGLLAIEREVAPEALANTGAQGRSAAGGYTIPENDTGSITKLKKSQYKLLPNAKKIVLAIRFQKFLASYAEGLGDAKLLFNDTNDKIVEILGKIAGKAPGIVGGGARLITTLYSSAKISGQVALGFAAFMPKGVSEFYVRLAGTKRGNGDPVYAMKKGQTVPLDFYVVTKWGGRSIVSEDDVKGKFGDFLKKKGLQKVFDKLKLSKADQDAIIDKIFKAAVTQINAVYKSKTGMDSPWLSAAGAITAPPGKNPELKINDPESNIQRLKLISVTTVSTKVLKIAGDAPVAANTIRLSAIDTGCNVGIRVDLVYPDLANVINASDFNDGGTKALTFVKTSINVPNADGSCPGPTPTPLPIPGCSPHHLVQAPKGNKCYPDFIDCDTGACSFAD